MKTILQILPSLNKINGGVERGTLDVARTLAEKGFKSVIISSGGEMAEKYKYKGVDHYQVNLASKGMVNFFSSKKKLNQLILKISPDVVHIRSRWPAFCIAKLIKKKQIPLVTTFHGTYSGNNFFLKKMYNRVMTSGDVVVTISKFIDDHVRFYFPESKKKLVQINRGIDTKYFNLSSVSEIRKQNFISNLAISENTHLILLPARLTFWKGHRIAIDAAKIIKNKNPNLNFLIVFVGGQDKKKKTFVTLKKYIKRNNLENNIIFSGNVSDMPAIYSIADIVLSTSIEPEAFGRVSAEASSMTKPVISTNHGGSREIIEDNMTGWLIEPGNSEMLAEKIMYVLSLPQEKKDLIGNNARRRVMEKFSLEQMLEKKISVYEELIERKKNSHH